MAVITSGDKAPHKFVEGFTGTDTTIVEPWVVHTDDADTTSFEVIWESGIPKVGDQYSLSLLLYQVLQGGVTATRLDNNKKQWLVTVTYTATGLSIGGGSVDRLTAFSMKTRVYTRTADSCYEYFISDNDKAESTTGEKEYRIYNSAKDPFEPSSVQEEYYHKVLSWTQREIRSFDYTQALDFQGTLNQESITILGVRIDKGKGLMRTVDPVLSTDEDGDFEWRCSYEVEIAEIDHWLTALDAGYNFLDENPTEKRAILYGDIPNPPADPDEAAEQVQDPVALNGDGGILGSGDPVVFGRYRTKPYKDWNNGLDLLTQKIRG
jgi:hypothetical protein